MSNDNTLSLFNFYGHDVRVVMIDDAPWWVAADVYQQIGLKQWGGVLNPLADDEKAMRGRTSLGLPPGRDMWTISESGLYKLIMRSDKPEARAFQDWVTRIVLPTIRKDGAYVMGEETAAAEETAAKVIEALGSNFSFLSSDEVRPIPRGLASGKGMAKAWLRRADEPALR